MLYLFCQFDTFLTKKLHKDALALDLFFTFDYHHCDLQDNLKILVFCLMLLRLRVIFISCCSFLSFLQQAYPNDFCAALTSFYNRPFYNSLYRKRLCVLRCNSRLFDTVLNLQNKLFTVSLSEDLNEYSSFCADSSVSGNFRCLCNLIGKTC